jgi:hypothetical protein
MAVWAADKPFPETGSGVPRSFAPLVVNGNWKDPGGNPVDRYHSLICRFGIKPAVLVFARRPDEKGLFNFLKQLQGKIEEHKDQGLAAGAVFVGPDDRRDDPKVEPKELIQITQDKARLVEDLKERAKSASLKDVLVGVEGPGKLKDFNIPKTSEVMIVLYRNYRVVRTFTLKPGELEKEAGKILEAVKQLAAAESQQRAPKKEGE